MILPLLYNSFYIFANLFFEGMTTLCIQNGWGTPCAARMVGENTMYPRWLGNTLCSQDGWGKHCVFRMVGEHPVQPGWLGKTLCSQDGWGTHCVSRIVGEQRAMTGTGCYLQLMVHIFCLLSCFSWGNDDSISIYFVILKEMSLTKRCLLYKLSKIVFVE